MNRYTTKHYRRLGLQKGDAAKDPTVRRNYPPGVHGPKGRKRLTQYGLQLFEKQKAKVLYGLTEKQFRKYYEEAFRLDGNTSQLIGSLLERRLDNVIYRSGFAKTRSMAAQMVNHGMFELNGKKIDIRSYQVKVKDEITIKATKQDKKVFNHLDETLKTHEAPAWMNIDKATKKIKITGNPTGKDAEQAFDPQLIVEFYSR